MATKNKEEAVFTPVGLQKDENEKIVKATDLPKPTRKKHTTLGLSDDDVKDMFRLMYLQRRFEERAMQMYQKGKFGGFLHLYIGQEAVSTGCAYAMNGDDDIITAYRDHGWGLVRGIDTNAAMAELYGKKTGCSKGKGGSMHFANVDEHFWGGYGIVGGHIPLGAGIAFANKYQENDRVTACFLGDGAVVQGALHETMNMSKLWNLPVIFAVENNGYAMGTAARRHSAGEIVDRAKGFDIDHKVINGMDVFSVYEDMKEIVEDVRENPRPYFVEIRTYRYRGHSMSDPLQYRTKEELEDYQDIDPIERIKDYLKKKELMTDEDIDQVIEDVDQEVLAAIDFAEESDFPDEEALYDDMFVEDDPYFHT